MPRVRLVDLRREAGYPLSAPLLAELGIAGGAGRQGDPPPQPPRRGAGTPLPRLRDSRGAARVRRRADPARRRPPALPPLRLRRARAARVSRLRVDGARARRRRHAAARDGARAPRAGAGADPARRRHGRASRARCARRSSASAPPSARCSSARRWWPRGTTFPGVDAGRRGRRRHGPRAPGLPRRGADVPARHAARRSQRARRPGARARADVPARRDAARVRAAPRRRRLPRRRARAARARSATRRSGTSSPSSSPGPSRRPPLHVLRELRARPRGPRRRSARSGAAAPAARPPPCAARGQDVRAAPLRRAAPRSLLAAAGPAMRRDGLTAVVDVDPQSL